MDPQDSEHRRPEHLEAVKLYADVSTRVLSVHPIVGFLAQFVETTEQLPFVRREHRSPHEVETEPAQDSFMRLGLFVLEEQQGPGVMQRVKGDVALKVQ